MRSARGGPPALPDPAPPVTVIIPTYDYSSVLRHAIRSVLWQTYTDFELLVIGDGCTDDSEEVVASFADPRVRWRNLPENAGSQSAPNNAGLDMAAGKYVAYLGHDDLWHPWHLAAVVGALERGGKAWAHGLVELIGPPGSRLKLIGGLEPTPERTMGRWVPPTSMVHRADAGREVRWRLPRELERPTDVDFADRLQLAVGSPLRVHALTSFKFVATWRPGCYRTKRDDEQAAWARRVETEPRRLERELASLFLHRVSP
ncbi:MAG: glycosyltransferase family 2 protein, partial [Actinomycetota bacterium]|nr:glycosyltransferase family 2 protein [Actinomycetota bacterium]